MSSSTNWIESPLDIVKKSYNESGNDHVKVVSEFFSQRLSNLEDRLKIPSLNDVPLHNLRANSLVRFRCIIQDMFEPEYYMSEYESVNTQTGETRMNSGRYVDVTQRSEEEEVRSDSRNNVIKDREVYYCVPIPGETEWVKEKYSAAGSVEPRPSTSGENTNRDSLKRSHDDCPGSPESVLSSACSTLDDSMSDGNLTETDEHMDTADPAENVKRTKINNNQVNKPQIQMSPDLNFPLPDEKGPACIVKVYEQTDEPLKVNDMVEFVGILSIDPALSAVHDNSDDPMAPPSLHDEAELRAHCPPPSLVPRLHCVNISPLSHNNPLLHHNPGQTKDCVRLLCEAKEIRSELLSVLEQMLFGDVLAAEYLLCHIISTVYARRDVLALGKFSMNLSGCPKSAQLAQYLSKLFSILLTKVHLMPLSLAHMNAALLSPKKDYDVNRLVSGALQLARNTELVVDETQLEAGQLNDTGVKNVSALDHVIQWQKVEYDMVYSTSDFTSNLQVLVVSEGKSFLPSDCRVHLEAKGDINTIRERYSAATQYLTPALLDKIRAYITLIQNTDYNISDQMQKVLEQHFVEMRRGDPKQMTHDHFNVLLVLTRLLSLSYGETSLSLDVWNRTKELEKQRQRRLV